MRDQTVRLANQHLSDQNLLLYADGELSLRHASHVRDHLAACWICRARTTELENAIADFVHMHQTRIESQVRPVTGLRANLKAHLAAAKAIPHKSRSWSFENMVPWRSAWACIAVLIIAAGGWSLRSISLHRLNRIVQVEIRALPDRMLTPGSTRAVKLGDLCARRHADAHPAVDVSTLQTVFRKYGLPVSTSNTYELDYLITPELGGADDVRNLWPEPYASTAWNAHVKDDLEDRLHEMVCEGKIDLSTAQNDIASNWIVAYERYFHTDHPLPSGRI